MTQLKATLDLEKKEIEIDFLEKEKEEQLLLLLGALAILTILTVSFIFVSISRKKLKLQRKQLESLNATKDKLFTILSHDLRSPVANLQSNISLMNLGALSQEEFSQSVKELGGEVQNVNGMLENMLFWATTQMGGIKARSSVENVHELLTDQFNLSNNIAKQKDISLLNKLPKELKIKVDVNHFRIILRNIIHNAIKFTPAGGFIEVSFENLDAHGLIKVKDSGIGMSPQEVNQLFDFGARNNKAGTNLETGTGVGLVLVKELIDLNGLELKVESQIGEGSVFTIVFPIEKE